MEIEGDDLQRIPHPNLLAPSVGSDYTVSQFFTTEKVALYMVGEIFNLGGATFPLTILLPAFQLAKQRVLLPL